ncbi:MAG: hypothetical protein Q9200_003070 [Gallowayella weberi]
MDDQLSGLCLPLDGHIPSSRTTTTTIALHADDLPAELLMSSVTTAGPPLAPSSKANSTPSPRVTNLNVQHVVLGNVLFKTWYPSYYPEELVGRDLDRLYVCQWCFKYCPDLLFSQNLSLFAKLFLDNKSVFFDVASFNYYLLVHNSPDGPAPNPQPQTIGFFSKEKMSWDNNNLACILVFPPWQRKGFGKILMGMSYELSRLEDRVGGPEKPLSELGRIGYLKFWQARVVSAILAVRNKTTLRVEEIADACCMLPEDVITTLKEMDVLGTKRKNDGSLIISKARVRAWLSVSKVDLTAPVDEAGFADDYLVDVEE